MGDCKPEDGGCLATVRLAEEVHALVLEMKLWTNSHITSSERFISEQDKKVDLLFAKLEKCLDTMTETAILQAAISPAVKALEKSIDNVAQNGRAGEAALKTHKEKDNKHFVGSEKNLCFGGIVAQWVAIGLISLFLLMGEHGKEFVGWIKFWK